MSSDARLPGRLPSGVRPLAYDLSLEVDPDEPRFSGEVRISLELDARTEAVHLHARELTLHAARVSLPGGEELELAVAPAEGPGSEPEYGEIALRADELLPAGRVELHLNFDGPFSSQMCGLYRVKDGDAWYAFTQFEAADARRCFPCFDEPGFKVPFDLSLMFPSDLEVFANTPEVERDTQEGWTRVRFAPTRPLPTYLLAFLVGPMEVVRASSPGEVPIRILVPRGKAALAGTAARFIPELLGVLEEWFGRRYPYAKLDAVAVPEFAAGAMENAGLMTFREELLLADPATLTRSRERLIAEVAAHEIAHHWFGNLVTMKWWDDLWLNEAFATWIAAKAVDLWRPELDQVMELLLSRAHVVASDSLPAARRIRQEVTSVGHAEQAFDAITYYKGALLLTMVERWIGERAFQDGVRAYLAAHEWGNATGADLFEHLDRTSGEDVSGLCRTFLDQPGLPLVEVATDGNDSTWTQRPYALAGLEAPAPEARWRIPVPSEAGWRLLTEATTRSPGAPTGHPNPGEWGYYRWRVPEETMRSLADPSRGLDLRSRLGVLENAWAAVAVGAATPALWLDVARSLHGDPARPMVELLVDGLHRLHSIWPELDGDAGFARLAAGLLRPHVDRLGWEPRDEESEDDTIVRPRVMRAMGRLGDDAAVLSAAHQRARAYLDDSRSVPADLAGDCLALAARDGHLEAETLAGLLHRSGDPEQRLAALAGLAALPAGATATRALDLTLAEAFRAQDFNSIFKPMMARHETRAEAFAWLEKHFAEVAARQPEFTFVHIGTIVGYFRDESSRDRAADFLRSRAVPGGERAIDQGWQRATHAITLRRTGVDALRSALGD